MASHREDCDFYGQDHEWDIPLPGEGGCDCPGDKPRTYVVAVYEADRAYGGPEEGGWWYDCGTLLRLHAVVKNEDAAYARARRINQALAYKREHNRERHRYGIGSVCYAGGHYVARVFPHTAPALYPEGRPHYE